MVVSEFIQGMSQFSVKGDKASKLKFAFRIYDVDNDGYISNGELFQVSWKVFWKVKIILYSLVFLLKHLLLFYSNILK